MMAFLSTSRGRAIAAGALLVVAAGAGALGWMLRNGEVRGDETELNALGLPGEITRSRGQVLHLEAVSPRKAKQPALSDTATWKAVPGTGSFQLGALYRVGPGSELQLRTAGGFLVNLDGDGEFYFEESSVDAAKTSRRVRFYVKKGLLRVKSPESPTGRHLLIVETPKAVIRGENGSFGVRLNDVDGNGQVWALRGKASVTYADGRVLELPLKEVKSL